MSVTKIVKIIPLLFFSLLMTFCSKSNRWISQWRSLDEMPGHLTIQFPLENSVFPPDIAPSTMTWVDEMSTREWFIVISDSEKNIIHSAVIKDTLWSPDSLLWQEIKAVGLEKSVTISVMGVDGSKIVSGDKCSITTSPDSVGASIFYRAVPLPFLYAVRNCDKIRWHLGDISSSGPASTLMKNLPLCGNCHSFTRDGQTLAMDVDYANDKGSYVISNIVKETVLTPDKIITWSSYRPEDRRQTYGLLSQISPDGRYVASTVKDRSIFVATEGLYYSQLFFPIKGIIVIYDRRKDTFFSLPGADDPYYVQSNPNWSPDGKYLYFCREVAYTSKAIENTDDVLLPTELAQEFIDGKRGFKYDVFRIPFNEGKGGEPEPVPGASLNGISNFFPRPSPDGKWLVFCKADNFMLLQPDSKLYIMPIEGGKPRLLSCNTDEMNSWHSWSPNSRWLVFTSKIRSPYTDLMLTHIDERGRSSPPILLEHLAFDQYAINIPEFVNLQQRKWTMLVDEFSHQAPYYFTKARSHAAKRQVDQAMIELETAIHLDPTYPDPYILKGHIEFANDMYEKALDSYGKALLYEKQDAELYRNYGTTCYKLGKYKDAVEALTKSDELQNGQFEVYLSRALAYAKMDKFNEAMTDFERALNVDPNSPRIYYERGICYALLKDIENAIWDLEQAAKLDPDHAGAYEKLGSIYYQSQDYRKAIDCFTTAITLEPNNYKLYEYRGDSKYKLMDLQGALADYSRSIEVEPRAGTSYYRRGVVSIQVRDKQSGCSDLLMARELGIREAEGMLQKHCQK